MAKCTEGFLAPDPRLRGLTRLIQAISARQDLDQLLVLIRSELAGVMDVRAVSVKLLGDDRATLHYAASQGLPRALEGQAVQLARSPFNQRIIDGELYVTGRVSQRAQFQFEEGLRAEGIESVLFVPLRVNGRVIGILGAYCSEPDRFGHDEVETFQIVASLVAISIENARAEAVVQQAARDRTRFLLRVTHNCRAPLAAMIGMLDLIRGGYLGETSAEQAEYLRRIDRRARSLHTLVGELMVLAEHRASPRREPCAVVAPEILAGRVRRTFEDEARRRGLALHLEVVEGTPPLAGRLADLEQVLENLISNALRYTPEGQVRVRFAPGPAGRVEIRVRDTGIGIPVEVRDQLFQDYFRAPNARALEEHGTGLGLVIVREIVEQHGGRVAVEDAPGGGTVFVLSLPAAAGQETPC